MSGQKMRPDTGLPPVVALSEEDLATLEKMKGLYATLNDMLRAACVSKSGAVCRELVRWGASTGSLSKVGRSALHFAAKVNKLDACRALVGCGADPLYAPVPPVNTDDRRISVPDGDDLRRTPFEMAIAHGATDVVAYFVLECGCDPAERGASGKTPIEIARKDGTMKQLLRSLKVDRSVNAQTTAAGAAVTEARASRNHEPL
jgi:ankyrin repeat protein